MRKHIKEQIQAAISRTPSRRASRTKFATQMVHQFGEEVDPDEELVIVIGHTPSTQRDEVRAKIAKAEAEKTELKARLRSINRTLYQLNMALKRLA